MSLLEQGQVKNGMRGLTFQPIQYCKPQILYSDLPSVKVDLQEHSEASPSLHVQRCVADGCTVRMFITDPGKHVYWSFSPHVVVLCDIIHYVLLKK